MIVFAYTKFGLVRMQGSEVKREGGGGIRPPRSERVLEIPIRVGLKRVSTVVCIQFANLRNRYFSEKLS